MGKKLSELDAATDFAPEDVFHLRTTGGIDKKITGEDCFSKYDRGEVASFIRKVRPGWIWCDGSTISDVANPEYAELIVDLKAEAGADAAHPYYHADADKAVLPDLRGAAVRGVDAAANRDKDGVRKSGNYQADDNKTHTHPHYHSGVTQNFTPTSNIADTITGGVTSGNKGLGNNTGQSTNSNAQPAGATEATMKNVALYILIKY